MASGMEDVGSEPVMTMEEYLEDQDRLADEAEAVLGPSDSEHCTFTSDVAFRRQALYSCLDCTSPVAPDYDSSSAAICLACANHCHRGHELVELYTKRHFKCDCGTPRCESNPCLMLPNKLPSGHVNKYDHNFAGLYCVCNRPHPDPDRESLAMVQCIVCEDWLHQDHLGRPLDSGLQHPSDDDIDNASEIICYKCTDRLPWLLAYQNYSTADNDTSSQSTSCKLAKWNDSHRSTTRTEGVCLLMATDKWRSTLCRCESCLTLYASEKVEFLTDSDDTLSAYEGRARMTTDDVTGASDDFVQSALSSMDRVQQVEVISGWNDLKSNFVDFFAPYAKEGRVVTSADVKAFFDDMASRKLACHPPPNCR